MKRVINLIVILALTGLGGYTAYYVGAKEHANDYFTGYTHGKSEGYAQGKIDELNNEAKETVTIHEYNKLKDQYNNLINEYNSARGINAQSNETQPQVKQSWSCNSSTYGIDRQFITTNCY